MHQLCGTWTASYGRECVGSSRLHKRCGTSFCFWLCWSVFFCILFLCLVPFYWVRLFGRLLMVPVVAGISFEIIQWAGRSDSKLADILSKPGLAMQKLDNKGTYSRYGRGSH